MKITSRPETPQVQPVNADAKPASATATPSSGGDSEPAARMSLSSDASFIQSLRDEADGLGEVRPEVVAEARAEIDAGTLGNNVDVDQMVDALLADL